VYNVRRLKNRKDKNSWNVISEAIVQKHQIKSLYCNRQALEQTGLSLFSREATQRTSKLSIIIIIIKYKKLI